MDAARTYHLRPSYRRWTYVLAALSVGLGAVLMVTFLSVVSGADAAWPFVLLAAIAVVVFGGIALMIVRAGSRVSVTIGPEDIEYRSIGYRLVAPWSEVESLGPVILGALSGPGITLRHSAVAPGGGWVRLANVMDLTALMGPGYDRVIPLAQFAKPLSGSALLADLRRSIPDKVAAYEERTTT